MGALLAATASTKQGFISQETLDKPFDVTLVVEDGKEFKAHKRVLSEASTFFEKLLNSGMRESNEGIVRLEMLTELGLRDLLEFVYTGNVQISAEDNAQDLLTMADYFDLPHLKVLAEKVLVQELNASNSLSTYCFAKRFGCEELIRKAKEKQRLNVSNCISTHYTAKRYQCEELIREAEGFIYSNFIIVARTEEFLDLSRQEVKMWISSDEINVSAEKDVFEIILTWIDHEQDERKKHFSDLFHEVRLVHVSRDFVRHDIVTNDLVNENEDCMELVQDALKSIDSEDVYHLVSVTPRKSLVCPALIVGNGYRTKDNILCYYPREAKWSMFRGRVVPPYRNGEIICCHGQLYFIFRYEHSFLHYEFPSNSWVQFPCEEQTRFHCQFFVARNEIYALFAELNCPECLQVHSSLSRHSFPNCVNYNRHVSLIKQFKLESNTWEEITSFDFGWKLGICIVVKDNLIYFLGGETADSQPSSEAGRYDVSTNSREKIADLKLRRSYAYGAPAYGKLIFIHGAEYCGSPCEAYNELTNEWQLI